ncbi:MAG: virulence-associated protein E [Lachnospiraceae bacterium]|nr:virulence-associated protein E [Clostridia bacterium]MBR1691212.1 virulence-associated protein E [Lachnospiraceae bacterium]
MNYDRLITITTGNNRRSINWQPLSLMLSEFYEKLRIPARSTETMQEYLALKKSDQDDRKDIGGFVAGSLSGPRRKAGAVTGRDVITLDYDNIPVGGTEDILRRVEGLGCGYCIYSTRKHSPATPRLRILLPFDRTATPDEYEPCARFLADNIGMEFADPTTFEATRLMYWPSCCSDSEYVFVFGDKPMLSVDGLLAAINAKYGDWRDVTKWPQVPGAENQYKKLATRQSDPLGKSGIIGAFCRTYDIYQAIDTFLDKVYEPVETMPGRYTYLNGSTTGGAVVYDNGSFLYSHHSTDPCSGKLVNSFDMVRLHKFGEMDDAANEKTPPNRLPSYLAMCEFAVNDTKVSRLMAKERAESAVSDFGKLVEADEQDLNWAQELELNNQTGTIKATIDNIWLILENDPNLKGKFALNEFAGRGEILGDLPWSGFDKRRAWADNDNSGLYWYFEKVYKLTGNGKIDSALSLHSEKHKFNDVKNYLIGLTWDGIPRLDTLFIDYLGAEDKPYTRAVTRKAFTAAVARAMEPGCKYDTMLILSGPQGIGKSTLLAKMSRGWFNDGIRTFEGKEASELLQGVWLVEIGELDAFRRTDVARIKQFLSLRSDRFRAAYGRHVKDIPRCCVFFGTTNSTEFLRDRTGNRRFWPVDVGIIPRAKSIWKDLDGELNQIWAEAVMRWRMGESLYLIGELEEEAKTVQESHREMSSKEGVIIDFLEKQIPADWQSWSLDKRRMFLGGTVQGDLALAPRDRVCALEVWCEVFGGQPRDFHYQEAQEINDILRSLPGWEKTPNGLRFGYCGYQRGFQRRKD